LTAWFIAVQTMATFGFIVNIFFMLFLVIVATTNYRASVKALTATATLAALTCLFSMIAVSVFGAFTDVYRPLDRLTGLGLDTLGTQGKWMPRPEYNFLSWSYILEVFCGIFSFIACKSKHIFKFKLFYFF